MQRASLLAIITALLASLPGSANGAVARRATSSAAVGVRLTGESTAIPRAFLGVGVETSELESYTSAGGVFDRALSLMRSGSAAPMQLRVGGYSADEAYWGTSPQDPPPGVFEIGAEWVNQLAALAQRDRLQVSVAVNLAVHSPSMAAGFARTVSQALAPSPLAGLAVGDEPDLYVREPSLDSERVASTLASTPTAWTSGYSPSSYQTDWLAYAKALATAVPGVPLVGPELALLSPAWVQALAGLGPLTPAALTVHRYPTSCRPPGNSIYPRISLLLAERSSAGLAAGLSGAISFAHNAGMSLVVSEMNSASCGGPPGVANSFATALWAPDALFELLHAGVDGILWHLRLERQNSPFEVQGTSIQPWPELYGLALFAQMLRGRPRLVAAQVTAPRSAHVKVWAVSTRREARVLVINKGPRAATVLVRVGAAVGTAHVERLLAPSVSATAGVTLAGRSIGTDARWHGRERVATVPLHAGTYRVSVPPYSAALLTGRARRS